MILLIMECRKVENMNKICRLCGENFETTHNRSIRCPKCQSFMNHINRNTANRNRRRKKGAKVRRQLPGFWEKALIVIKEIESGNMDFKGLDHRVLEYQYRELKRRKGYRKILDKSRKLSKEEELAKWIEESYLKSEYLG